MKIEIDRWTWGGAGLSGGSANGQSVGSGQQLGTAGASATLGGSQGFRDTIDITNSVMSFNFSKTIRAAMGAGSVNMVPLINVNGELLHVLDAFNVMDVVKIYEFDQLKFQGYIRRIGTSQSMGQNGAPVRSVVLTITHIGGLLQEATIGFELLALRIKDLDDKLSGFNSRLIALTDAISNKMRDGGVLISDIISTIIDEWFTLLSALGATQYRAYLNKYIDFKTGLAQFTATRVLPSDLAFFYGSNSTMSIWAEIQKLTEAPFNEIFFDEGQRSFWYSGQVADPSSESGAIGSSFGEASAGASLGPLSGQKTYLVGRPTPFDGNMRLGTRNDYFKIMPTKTIPLKWVTHIDLGKSSEEAYSLYCSVPLYAAFNELTLMCAGFADVDNNMVSKYLLRPLIMKLFYATVAETDTTSAVSLSTSFEKEMKNATQTLKNWYANNDRFLSGVMIMQVPKNGAEDVYLGEKIKLDGIDGRFYAEGVSHSWTYGGSLVSHVTITRGWDYDMDRPIKLNNKFFMGAGFPTKDKTRGGIV